MKSILKSFKFLVLLAALVTGITTQAMEQEKITPSDTVTERICLSFDPILEATFKETPKNFYEAIVRIKCIAQLLEKSQIKLRKNFNLMHEECRINSIDLPFHMIHPIFKYWLDDACNNILLSHEKSVEAIEIIIETLSKKVNHENLKLYKKAVNSLPVIVAEHIKEQFIDMHGWPQDIKPYIEFDSHGKIIAADIATENLHIYTKPDNWVRTERILLNDKKSGNQCILGCNTYINDSTHDSFVLECRTVGLMHMQESGVYSPLWQKPTFKQALKKRAQENEESQNASIVTKIWNYCLGK